jgi:hypothetical protein
MLIVDSSIFKVAKSFSFSKLIVSFSCLSNLLLLNGLGFINVVIFLSLKFKVYALRLDQLQSTSDYGSFGNAKKFPIPLDLPYSQPYSKISNQCIIVIICITYFSKP